MKHHKLVLATAGLVAALSIVGLLVMACAPAPGSSGGAIGPTAAPAASRPTAAPAAPQPTAAPAAQKKPATGAVVTFMAWAEDPDAANAIQQMVEGYGAKTGDEVRLEIIK